MSGRPLLAITLPVLTVLAICLYLRRRGRSDSDPPEPSPPDPPAAAEPTQAAQPAAEEAAAPPAVEQTAGRDLGQVTAWVRDNIETRAEPEPEPEPAAVRAESVAALSAAAPPATGCGEPVSLQEETPQPAMVGAGGDVLRELEAAVRPAQTAEQDRGDRQQSKETPAVQEEVQAAGEAPVAAEEIEEVTEKTELTNEASPVVETEVPATPAEAPLTSAGPPAAEEESHVPESQPAAAASAEEAATPGPEGAAEASESAANGADTASENSSDSGKGGSSASLEQASPSSSPESVPLQTTVYDFLIPQKLCGRLIGKNGTFVNMLKARTGAHVIIRLHPVKSSVKICSVDGTQTEIDACLKMIREKFPVNKFPAMTLEQLNRPSDQPLAVPDSQQLHLPQGVTCDVLVSAVVSAGQLFLQQHTHPTFRGLERLTTLMAACYADGGSTPELPRPVVASSICAAPVAGGWYRAQVVAFYPDSDELDVRFMDFGGYSRIPAAHARQIRTDFMSLPFQAEECYLANVMPVSEDGWSLEAGAVFESLITDRALEAMVVGYAEDGTPFVNLYSIQGTEYGNSAISLVNQQLVESGAARWVESQA